MRRFFALSLVPLFVSASPVLVDSIHNDAAPVLSSTQYQEIPDSYMIVFKKDVLYADAVVHQDWVQGLHVQVETTKANRDVSRSGFKALGGLKHTYNIPGGLLGYSGYFSEEVIGNVRRHPQVRDLPMCNPLSAICTLDRTHSSSCTQVAYIEKDSIVHTMHGPEIEKDAPWGLARISHRKSLSFGTVNKYLFSEDGGEGVDVYVIDTGTNIEHVDFEGRAHWGKTIPPNDVDEDGNGHGTHCSGTIAGKKYGVAKKANVYAVKVLKSNGSGSMSDVVKGVEWAAVSHNDNVEAAKKGKGKKGFKGSAANMSLGGSKSTTLDLAVNAAVDAGLHFAVAAGNDNLDSCNYSPAAAEKAVTVGASTISDERAYFSNYGKCNDIFAPGLNILSTWTGSKYATNKISGTSMASPHIAGLLAYFLSLQPVKDSAFAVADVTPKQLKDNLLAIATVGTLTDVPNDTKNVS